MPARSRVGDTSAVAAGLGLALVVLGSFLPWLKSGRVTRNSYETSGTIRRLIAPTGPAADLFRLWPLLGLVCAVAVALYLFGLVRTGFTLATIASVAAGSAAFVALDASATTYAAVVDTGPTITIAGTAAVLIAVLVRIATALVRGARTATNTTSRTEEQP